MRALRVARGIALLAAASAACAAPTNDGERVVQQKQAIQGGEAEPARANVGMLEFASGNFGTATLITPRVVVTAGHVVGGDIQGFFTGNGRAILRGPDTSASAEMKKYAVSKKLTHPSYQCATDCEKFNGADLDIGLVLLDAPATEYVTVTLGSGALGAPGALGKGTTCSTTGYGNHVLDWDAGDAAPYVKQKRSASVRLLSMDANELGVEWITGISDHGDSGGPLWCGDALVGTTAYHVDGDGPEHRQEFYVRIDAALPWIREQVLAWGDTTLQPKDTPLEAGADAASDPPAASPSPAEAPPPSGCNASGQGLSGGVFLLVALAALTRTRTRTSSGREADRVAHHGLAVPRLLEVDALVERDDARHERLARARCGDARVRDLRPTTGGLDHEVDADIRLLLLRDMGPAAREVEEVRLDGAPDRLLGDLVVRAAADVHADRHDLHPGRRRGRDGGIRGGGHRGRGR